MSIYVTKGMEVDSEPRDVHAVRALDVGDGAWYVDPNRTFCGIDLRLFHPARARIAKGDPDCPLCLLAGEPFRAGGAQTYQEAGHKQPVPA